MNSYTKKILLLGLLALFLNFLVWITFNLRQIPLMGILLVIILSAFMILMLSKLHKNPIYILFPITTFSLSYLKLNQFNQLFSLVLALAFALLSIFLINLFQRIRQ